MRCTALHSTARVSVFCSDPSPPLRRRTLLLVGGAAAAAADMLQDRQQARQLARLLDPLVRAVDGAVGEQVAMLVEVEYAGRSSQSVGGGEGGRMEL